MELNRRSGRGTRQRQDFIVESRDENGSGAGVGRRGGQPADENRIRGSEPQTGIGALSRPDVPADSTPNGVERDGVGDRRQRDGFGRKVAKDFSDSEGGKVEEMDYQAMCSSQGPSSVGVTWDFSSPSPSQYKKFSQKSYAKREEETNRIAEQMRSDGVHSRFLMGRIGEREGGNNSDESSSFTSIAALAKLNKRSKGVDAQRLATTTTASRAIAPTRSILDEVLELREEATKADEDETNDLNLNASLGVHPLETSDDESGKRLDDSNLHADNSLCEGIGDDVNGIYQGGGGGGGGGRERMVTNSTPKNRVPLRGDGFQRQCGSPLLRPNAQSVFASPSMMNRSFPRPTQSVSPEFPFQPKRDSSPEDSIFSSSVSRPTASATIDRGVRRKSVDGKVTDDDWSDMDDSLLVRTATQVEEQIEKAKSNNERDANKSTALRTNRIANCLELCSSKTVPPVTSVAVPPTPPSTESKRMLSLLSRRRGRKCDLNQVVDLTLSEDETTDETADTIAASKTKDQNRDSKSGNNRPGTFNSTASLSSGHPGGGPSSSNHSPRRCTDSGVKSDSVAFQKSDLVASHKLSKSENQLRLKVLRRSFSPHRQLPGPKLPSPIPEDTVAFSLASPRQNRGLQTSTPPAHAASTSFCFSDVDDVDLSLVEAASQAIEEEKRERRESGEGPNVETTSVEPVVEVGQNRTPSTKKLSNIATSRPSGSNPTEIRKEDVDPASDGLESSLKENKDAENPVAETAKERSSKETLPLKSSISTLLKTSLPAKSSIPVSSKGSVWSDDDDLDDATLALLIDEVDSPKSRQEKTLLSKATSSSSSSLSTRSCSFPPRPPPTQTSQKPPKLSSVPLSSFSCSEPTGAGSKHPATNPVSSLKRSNPDCGDLTPPSAKLFKSSSFNLPRSSGIQLCGGGAPSGSSGARSATDTPTTSRSNSSLKPPTSATPKTSTSVSFSGASRFGKIPNSFAGAYKPVVTAVLPTFTPSMFSASPAPAPDRSSSSVASVSSSTTMSSPAASSSFKSGGTFKRHHSAAQLTNHLTASSTNGLQVSSSTDRLSSSCKSSTSFGRPSTSSSASTTSARSTKKITESLEDIEEDDDDDSLFDVFRKADEICQAFAATQK